MRIPPQTTVTVTGCCAPVGSFTVFVDWNGRVCVLQVGTFNEHVAQPQPNRFHAWVKSMGLEGDAMASSLWVDMFGDGITRDLEPTVQDGGRMWALFESCMRVFRTGAATCANLTES
jgi:hypothetical protein